MREWERQCEKFKQTSMMRKIHGKISSTSSNEVLQITSSSYVSVMRNEEMEVRQVTEERGELRHNCLSWEKEYHVKLWEIITNGGFLGQNRLNHVK